MSLSTVFRHNGSKQVMKCFVTAFAVLSVTATQVLLAEAFPYYEGVNATTLFQGVENNFGQPLRYPQSNLNGTVLRLHIASGGETGWHSHPYSGFVYVLKGKLTVETQGGKTVEFTVGHAYAEAVRMLHNDKNLGKEPVELIVFYPGVDGDSFMIKPRLASNAH